MEQFPNEFPQDEAVEAARNLTGFFEVLMEIDRDLNGCTSEQWIA
jgi:hypothetical protein